MIELLIVGKIMKTKLMLYKPSEQIWLINNNPFEVAIHVKLTHELERLAASKVTNLDQS